MEGLAVDVLVFVLRNWQAFFAGAIILVAAGIGTLIWRL